MAIYYVDPVNGGDALNGLSEANAWRTVNKAKGVVAAGDTVYLMTGNINETIDISRSGTLTSPITWRAMTGHTPVWRGASSGDHILYITGYSYNIFQDITFQWNGASPNPQKRFSWVRVSGTGARGNQFLNCTWARAGDIADILAAGWDDWGITIVSAKETELYQCTIYGQNQGIALRGTRTGAVGSGVGTSDTDTLIEECTVGPTIESNITIGTSYNQARRAWIKNCILQDSYTEDGIQFTHDSEQPDGNITNLYTYISGTAIRGGGENGVDFKAAGKIVVDGCIIYGQYGSGNGPVGGWNRNSLFAIGIGANQDADQSVVRNSIFYDCANLRLDWDHYYVYNNTFVACNRDYSGNPSTLGTPSGQFFFGGVRHVGGGAPAVIVNNISVGHDDGPYGIRLNQGNVYIDYNLISGIPYTFDGSTWTQAASFADFQTALENAARHTGNDANTITVANVAAVLFNNVPSRPTGLHTAFDFGLQAGSDAKGAGGPVTFTSGSGTNSTKVKLRDAGLFFDGFGIAGVSGDTCTIGTQVRVISAVDYVNGEITITEPATFSNNTAVYYGGTATPDIGAPAFGGSSGGGGGGGGTPAGTGAVVVAAFAAQVAGGDQAISLPTGLSASPLALKFVMSRAIANDTPADTASISIGFALPTSPSTTNFCINSASEHGQNPSDTFRKTYDDACVITINSTGGLDGAAVLKTVASDEVVITWTNAPGAAYLGYVVAYECEAAYLNSFAIQQTQNATTDVDVGFAPDLVFFASALRGIPDTRTNATFSYGILALVDSGYVTYAIGFEDGDIDSPTIVGARVASNYVLLDITTSSGSIQRGVTASVADTTLTMTTTVADWSDPDGEAVLFALKFDNLRVHAGVLSTPTTVSEYTYPDPGFLPAHVEIVGTLLEGINTGAADGKAGSIAIGAVDGSGGYSVAYTSEDAVTTSDTQSVADVIAMNLALDTGADGIEADIIELTSVGPKLDFTVVTGTAKTWIVVSVETPSNGMGATDEGFSEDYGVLSLTWQLAATDEGYGEDHAELTLDLNILSPTATDEGYAEDYASLSLTIPPITRLRKRTRTRADSRGLTLSVYEPLNQGDRFLFDITGHISDYSHEISALGGFWSASIRVIDRQGRLEDWYERGLDRRIVVYNPEGQPVFEGFVNSLTLNLAGLTKTVGPVLDISNQVRLIFSYVDSSGDTSVVGLRLSTDWAEDLISQARWGVIQRILSSGGATPEDADSLRDDYLRENAQPETDEQQSFGGSQSEPTLDLSILGYVHRLQNYVYNSTDTGAVDLSAKIAAILAAEPNGYLSSATGFIAPNTYQVAAYDNDNKVAWNIIKELAAKGDASNNRAIFGVYENRTVHYQSVVEQIDYYQALSDPAQRITTEGGLVVAPWDVRPGRWLFSTDFLVGRVPNATRLRSDPRAEFIEGVTYRAPWSLTLRGSKIRRIDQKLAKLGLAGIGG